MKNHDVIMPMGIITIIAFVLIIVAFFLLDIERISLNYWALAFLLLAQVAVFGLMVFARFSNVQYSGAFLKIGVASASFLYFLATIIGVFLVRFFTDNLNRFVLMHLVIIALFAIVVIFIFAYAGSIDRRGAEDIKKVGSKEAKRGGF